MSQPNGDHDRDGLSRWVREHGRAVCGFLFVRTGDRDLAEDLAQEVFCRAWEKRDRYVEAGNARSYLLRIADRLAIDQLRKRAREIHLAEDAWKQLEPSVDGSP